MAREHQQWHGLRASVIVKWLKIYYLRKVQYLAGHRCISATESYKQNEMEGLTEEVNKFHPLGYNQVSQNAIPKKWRSQFVTSKL